MNARGSAPSSYTVRKFYELSLFALALVGCAPKNPVEYVGGQCLISGVPATIAQVEARQAAITQHILARQPVLTGIAIAAVVVAGGGYLRRILQMLAARRVPSQSFAERFRARMERYRAYPVRNFMLVGSVLAVLAAAGIIYVSLDADKRTSERSLATLQFCHLALRSTNEQHVLAEQREHLASIQASEHDIRALVDQLPPAEKKKGQEIASQLTASLGQQRTLVAQFAEHADVTAKAVADGITRIDTEVVDLKSMPAAVGKLATDLRAVGATTTAISDATLACNAKLDELAKTSETLEKTIDALAARPPPACSCAPAAQTASAPPPPAAATLTKDAAKATDTTAPKPQPAPEKSPDSNKPAGGSGG